MTGTRKYSIALIIVAAIVVELIGGVQYYLAQNGAKQEILSKAQRDVQESKRVATVRTEVETAIKNAEKSVCLALRNPETSYCVASQLISVNQHIIGVGLAFIPDYYAKKGKKGLYMPYTFDDQPSITSQGKRTGETHIQTRVPSLDYTQREWYKTAMEGKSQWTEPYLGEGGINVLMCTYSIPIKDRSGQIVGTLFADVTMEDATILMNNMKTGIRKSGYIILGIQVLSFLLMVFIIWRAIVASRRYKEQMVDPEKEHLISQMAKLREVNGRLIKRNQDLAEKVAVMQRRLEALTKQDDDDDDFLIADVGK